MHTFRLASLASVASLAIALAAGSAAAQQAATWVVTEGTSGRGEWQVTVRGGTISGRGTMTMSGRQVSFGITGEVRGEELLLQRTASSDGRHCAYRGRVGADGRIAGTALCGMRNNSWLAVRK